MQPLPGLTFCSRTVSTGSILALTSAKLSLLEAASPSEMPMQRAYMPENHQILTPMSVSWLCTTSSSGTLTPISIPMLSSLKLSGSRFPLRCPLFPLKIREFVNLLALEAHPAFPAHASKIFHCPIGILGPSSKGSTARYCTISSGLTQHLESGACDDDGAATLEKAMAFVREKLDVLGYGAVRLVEG